MRKVGFNLAAKNVKASMGLHTGKENVKSAVQG